MLRKRLIGHLFAGVVLAGSAAGAARADDLTWSYSSSRVSICQVGTCSPDGIIVLGRSTDSGSNQNSASGVGAGSYVQYTNFNFGTAFSSAEAGEGALSLPVLHAYASGAVTPGVQPPYISVNTSTVMGVQGFTNTGTAALAIPLNAFSGVVDYVMIGPSTNPGTITAGLAITTSAVLDDEIANLWFASDSQAGHFGQFAATCATAGALALGNPLPTVSSQSGGVGVTTSSCTGQDTYLLQPGDSFYIWARLSVLRSAAGVTDASHTFNIEFSPEIANAVDPGLTDQLAQNLIGADGGNFSVPASAVPEPGTWAMLLAGFGVIGSVIRGRRRVFAGGGVRAAEVGIGGVSPT